MSEFAPDSFFDLSKYEHAALFENCENVWEALLTLSSYLQKKKLGKIEGEVSSSAHLSNAAHISIGKGTVVEPGAFIQGPCIIGRDCQIRHGAYIRGDVVIGDGCIVGHATEIKHSILLDEAFAPHFNYVGDSILGNKVNLGAGVVLANFRLDHAPIAFHYNEELIETHLKKFGSIIGDLAQIGCQSVLNPGTLIGKSVFCYPCLNVSGFIPALSKVKPSHKNILEE